MRVVCIYFKTPRDTKSIAEVFYKATPQIVLRDKDAIFLEISKCKALYSEKTFVTRAMLTLKRLNIEGKITVADDIPTALSFAIYNTNSKDALPLEAIGYYFNPLKKEDLSSPQIYKMIHLFKSLGLKTIADFLKVSPNEINNRFGSMGLMAYMKVQGQFAVIWDRFIPSKVVSENFEFDEESPVENLEPIYFRIRTMLDKIVLRLRSQGKRPKKFDVIFKQEHSYDTDQFYKVSVHLQLPYISNKVIFQITKEKIDAQVQSKPFRHRVTEFSVVVTEEAPYTMKQKNIFDQKKEENDESFFQLVSRIATRIGNNSVFFAKTNESYIPEKNWKRVQELESVSHMTDFLAQRPLRLFECPERIRFIDKKVILPCGTEDIENLSNKEIIFADWWESPLERIYYKLRTKSGKEFWVYKTSEGHFLHGVFD